MLSIKYNVITVCKDGEETRLSTITHRLQQINPCYKFFSN